MVGADAAVLSVVAHSIVELISFIFALEDVFAPRPFNSEGLGACRGMAWQSQRERTTDRLI